MYKPVIEYFVFLPYNYFSACHGELLFLPQLYSKFLKLVITERL